MASFSTKPLTAVLDSKPELRQDAFFQVLEKKCKKENVLIGKYEFGDVVVKNGLLEVSEEFDEPTKEIQYNDVPLAFLLNGCLEIYSCHGEDNIKDNVTAAVINSSNPFFGVFETCDFFSDRLTNKHIPIFKNFQIVSGLRNLINSFDLSKVEDVPELSNLIDNETTLIDCYTLAKRLNKSSPSWLEIMYFPNKMLQAIKSEPVLMNYILIKGWEQSYNLRTDQYNINEIKQVLAKSKNNDTKAKEKGLGSSVINYLSSLYIELIYAKKGILPSYVPIAKVSKADGILKPIIDLQTLLLNRRSKFSQHPIIFIPWYLSGQCSPGIYPLNKNTVSAIFPVGNILEGTNKVGDIQEVTKVFYDLQKCLPDKWKITNTSYFTHKTERVFTDKEKQQKKMEHARYRGNLTYTFNNDEEDKKIQFPEEIFPRRNSPFKELAVIKYE